MNLTLPSYQDPMFVKKQLNGKKRWIKRLSRKLSQQVIGSNGFQQTQFFIRRAHERLEQLKKLRLILRPDLAIEETAEEKAMIAAILKEYE